MRYRFLILASLIGIAAVSFLSAQQPPVGKVNDLETVEKLLAARKDYQKQLEQLRTTYVNAGDLERAKWAEEELRQWHRIPKYPFRLELDVPPPSLTGNASVPEATKLVARAMLYKDKGFGADLIDNQRRAEILLQELLSKYPQSDKISDAAFLLGDIYEGRIYKMPRRAAMYYERCFQWNPKTQFDARLRAARLYDRTVGDRQRALELYREVVNNEIEPRRVQEATKRIQEMTGASAMR
ncbi:MAG: tetratricopeptide repeat protein [Gemmataceae bacterium]|nr:tetratricopeptide repeat protein [Gemmataceae bacterium]